MGVSLERVEGSNENCTECVNEFQQEVRILLGESKYVRETERSLTETFARRYEPLCTIGPFSHAQVGLPRARAAPGSCARSLVLEEWG